MSLPFTTRRANVERMAREHGLNVPNINSKQWELLLIYGTKAFEQDNITAEAKEFWRSYYSTISKQ